MEIGYMRFGYVLCALVLLAGCQKRQEAKEMVLTPGSRGTFFAVATELAAVVEQPATENEPEFKYRVRVSPTRGISVGTAVGGEGQGDLSENQLFTPASITKVITSSIALKRLGVDFKFRTRVSWLALEGGTVAKDLSVRADGDPFVTKSRLKEIAQELKKRGVKRLAGKLNLISADPRKDLSIPAYGLDPGDYWSCYGSRVQNFNLLRNCSTIQVSGWQGEARWLDPGITAPLSFDSVRRSTTRLGVENDLDGVAVRGYVIHSAPEGKPAKKGLPVPDVKSWYGNALVTEMKNSGIDVSAVSAARDEQLPESESFELESAALDDIAKKMNKVSDNYLAESLYKATASLGSGKNINEAAAAVVRKEIGEWLGATGGQAFANDITLYDGAGLSRANKVTPRAFLSLLKAFTKEKWFPALWESLPIAGVDGTLKGRMRGNAAGHLVRAKTGTLKGAYQLAGYIPRLAADGSVAEYVPFVLLTATTPKNQGAARAFQDKLLGELAEQINGHKKSE
jgi:D-alanyl-D-alanine carboxypeptidase/D-alanyl-D-alanine-endopeptidase (penicillin-binding protein 4)